MHYFRLKNNITKGNVIPTCVAAFFFLFNITATKFAYKKVIQVFLKFINICNPQSAEL